MRFIFGRGWVHVFDKTDGEGDGNGDAGGAAGDGDAGGGTGDDAGTDAGADDVGAAGEKAADADADKGAGKGEPKDMLGAIDKALGYDKEAVAAEEKKKTDEASATAAAKAAAEKHANGAPKKNAAGDELDDKGQVTKKAEPAKTKTSTELALSKEQLAALKPESRARFAEVITTLKSREAEIASLSEKMKPLAEARDSMISVLQETKTSADQLSAYLEFNRLLSSDKPADLRSALKMIEEQRAALYTALGEEPADGGIDLLAEFPDLKQKVTDAQLTREDALELAAGRREKVAAEARAKQQGAQQQTVQNRKQAEQKAQQDLETWCLGLSKSDIDYKAKEEKLLEQVDEVIKTYPPNQWVSTLKLLYSGIVIQKASPPNKGQQPLRPSGAKGGSKAPQNMFEAMWGTEKSG